MIQAAVQQFRNVGWDVTGENITEKTEHYGCGSQTRRSNNGYFTFLRPPRSSIERMEDALSPQDCEKKNG